MILRWVIRIFKICTVPWKLFYAQYKPVAYAKSLGVVMKGSVRIYGSSYKMFSAEPCLVVLDHDCILATYKKTFKAN